MTCLSFKSTPINNFTFKKKSTHFVACIGHGLEYKWSGLSQGGLANAPVVIYCSLSFFFCVLVSHLSHKHMHTQKRDEKNWQPPESGCHDSPGLFLLIEHVATATSHPTGVLVLWMKWPNSQMAVLIWPGGQGGVYEPSCPCILCRPLSPSPPNTWVMAYLYTIIRQTHTYTLTVKSHQKKTHKQAHTRLAATLTQLQSLFTGGGLGWGGVRDEKWQAELLHLLWGDCVRRPCVSHRSNLWQAAFSAHALCDLSAIYFHLHR